MATRAHATTVFVVEDDASVRQSLERLMRSEGFAVRLFGSSEQFLEQAAAVPGSCLLLDITLPGISGLEVQRRLAERGIRVPVIAVSARDDDATRREARLLGAKIFFRKPIDDRTLIDAIDWAVNSNGDAPRE